MPQTKTARSSRRGFTVLEMIVAASLMLLALALASSLLLDAQASIANSSRRALDMSADLAFDQLRADLRNSIDFFVPFGTEDDWVSDEPLRLAGHSSGDTIVYDVVEGELLRFVYRPGFLDPTAQRLVLDRVRSFRWRSVPGTPRSALQVEITHEETAPLTGRTAAGQREAEESVIRTAQLVLSPRRMDVSEPSLWW